MRTLSLSVLAVALALSAGCGGKSKYHPVTGKVTFQNKPATGAMVVFHPKGNNSAQAIRPSGVVKEDGTYTLYSGPGEEGKGAPAGEYEVAVIWDAPPKAATGGMGAGMGGGDERREEKDLLGGRYKNPATSGLKATVGAGPTEVPAFELK
jgi:hypothetical protein